MALKLNLFGDNKLKELEDKIDETIKTAPPRLSPIKTDTSDGISSEILNQFLLDPALEQEKEDQKKKKISGLNLGTQSSTEIDNLLEKISVPTERNNRYKVYEEIYRSVPMIKRMMKVYTANILQKNPVNSKCLLIKENPEIKADIKTSENFEQNKEASRSFTEKILNHFDITDKLKYKILPNQALFGDCFVEVLHIDNWKSNELGGPQGTPSPSSGEQFIGESSVSPKQEKSKILSNQQISLMLENIEQNINSITIQNNFSPTMFVSKTEQVFNELASCFIDDGNDSILFEATQQSIGGEYELDVIQEIDDNISKSIYEYYQDQSGEMRHKLKEVPTQPQSQTQWPKGVPKEISLEPIVMLVHSPENVVILETEYGTRLGYIEVRRKDEASMNNIGQQLSTIIGKLTTMGSKAAIPQDVILNRLVKLIIKKIVSTSSKDTKGKFDIDQVLRNVSPEIYTFIKRLLIETDKSDPSKFQFKKVQARFIPIKRMFQFKMPSSEYAPYGSSIVDPLVLQSKLYILAQMSNIITKLSRAALVRKWILDVGPNQMQSGMIQKLKRELFNTRVTLDDLANFKSMPKLLSDFRDMFVLQKNGQRSIDVEVQNMGDPSVKIADLEDARKELIALSGKFKP